MPNRYFRQPPPYVYHPELYPELALKNPDYIPFTKTFLPKHERNPVSEDNFGILKGKLESSISIPEHFFEVTRDFSAMNEESSEKIRKEMGIKSK